MNETPRYLLDNAAWEAERRFSSLEALYDPVTFRHLAATGVGAGARCLEVGAGGGSVARRLAEHVGPSGSVLATDIDPRWFASGDVSTIEVRRHDIAHDPLPASEFDLVHARLVLIHLPKRDAVLQRMVAALRPGGWLVLEDYDLERLDLWPEPRDSAQELANRVWQAWLTFLEGGGVDRTYGSRLPGLLREAGLKDVQAEGHVVMAPGNSSASGLHLANIEQVRATLVGQGLVTDQDIDGFLALMRDPEAEIVLPLMVSAWGRRS